MASTIFSIPELLGRILLFAHEEQHPETIFSFCAVNRLFRAVGLENEFWHCIDYCAWTMKDIQSRKTAFQTIRAIVSRLVRVSSVVIQKDLLQTQNDWEFWASILRRCPRLYCLKISLAFKEPLHIYWNMLMLVETIIIDAEDFNLASCGIFRLLNLISCRTKIIHLPTGTVAEESIAFDCLFSGNQENLLLDGIAPNAMTDFFMNTDYDTANRLALPVTGLHVVSTLGDYWDEMPIFPNVRDVVIEMTRDCDSVERICMIVTKCPNLKSLRIVIVKPEMRESMDFIADFLLDDILNVLQLAKPFLGIVCEEHKLGF